METQKLTKYKTWRLLISSFILLSATGFASASYPTGFSYYDLPTTDKTYKPNELIVRFSDVSPGDQLIDGPVIIGPLTQSAVRNTVADYLVAGSSVTKQYKKIIPGLGVVKLPDGMSVIDALIRFNQSDCILYAEPNYKIKLQYKPNDTLYDEQWALENTGQDHGLIGADIDANEAWDILTDPNNPYSDDVVIAVIDTGIDYAHPDLYDNMWKNPGETRQDDVVEPNDFNEVDDDNNRYVDDIYGYDFFDEGDNDPCDEHYHGTHVAGIIAAVGDNDRGIAGVCWDPSWNIRLMALKIFGDEAIIEDEEEYIAWLGSTIEAIEYAVDNGADVINASWSIGYNYSQSLYDAVEETHDASILFVAAAGNDDYPSAVYPAAYNLDNIISVMATDNSDTRSIFSNYGSGVDLGAPGEEIISTTPEEPTGPMEDEDVDVDPGYDYLSGTSMAAPHVAGACALMKIVKPDLRYDEIKALILRSVDPVLPGLCVSGGRLNLYTALNMIRGGVVVNTSQPGVPYYTIQSAIDNAEDGDDLIAQQGRSYLETVDFNGLRIRLFSGDISYSGDPANMIVDPHNTFISAFIERHRHGYSGPVVRFTNGEGSGTLLKGFTVLDGGLGIQCSSLSNSPSISHCIITDNSGFGIFFGNNSSTISDCTISSNGGGGVYCSYSNPDIIDCEISDNNGLCTGGIHCYHSDPNIDTCTITRNTNWDGGSGIRARNGSDPNIHNCTITDNITDLVGGGIYLDEGTHSSISNCTILRNEANEWGGGIFLNNVSPPITDCTISDCYSDWEGGGIYCYDGAEPDIKNCTITGNHAGYDGGAIYNNKSNPLIKNCLITDNKADSWDCGGIFCEDASPTITNCTFAGNSSNDFDGKGGHRIRIQF